MAGQVQDFSETVVEILTTLKEVRQRLIDIRDDVLSARRIALMIVARLAQVEKRMANLCGRIERFHARVGEMKGRSPPQGTISIGGQCLERFLLPYYCFGSPHRRLEWCCMGGHWRSESLSF